MIGKAVSLKTGNEIISQETFQRRICLIVQEEFLGFERFIHRSRVFALKQLTTTIIIIVAAAASGSV